MNKIFILLFFFCIIPFSSFSKGEINADPIFIRPPYLKVGDCVGIVSPAGKIPATSDTAMVRTRFAEWGLKVKFGEYFFHQDEPYFSATDEQRASDLQKMINDSSVTAIIGYRGGYGSVRLLDLVDFKPLIRNPKWIVGYSDITMLHLTLLKHRIETIHGSMPISFKYDSADPSAESLRAALFGELTSIDIAPHPYNQSGVATGRLVGGNLSIIYSAAGTNVDLDLSTPSILVIEDIGEQVYHLDRMLQNLKHTGKLDKFKAIIIGHFSSMKDPEKFGVKDSYEVIKRYTEPLGIPVIYGFPFGHEHPNLSVYMGRKVQVSVTPTSASIKL